MGKIRKRKQHQYELRYTYNGKQYSVYGRTKQECLDKHRIATKGISKQYTKSMLFVTWYEKWLDLYKKPMVKDVTLDKIKSVFKNHILPYIANIPLKRIKTENVQAIINKLKTMPRQATIVYQNINSCLQQAMAVGLIYHNPCTAVIIKKNKGNKGKGLNKEQLNTLYQYLNGNIDILTRKLVLLYLNTGMRRNELLNIKYSDLDFDKNEIHIKGTKTKNSDRILQTTKDVLLMFPKKEKPFDNVTAPMINHRFKNICDTLGFEGITLHSLRHTFATRCIEQGVDMVTLKEWLGHKDISITINRYTHISEEFKQEQTKKLKNLL
ncbi:MAG: tyrosine-type recombinase/integrase [Christensenellales bacterium]